MVATLLVAACAALGVWFATAPLGPGLDPDAASYLGAAQSVAHGRGYRIPIAPWVSADSTSPLTHFPPGYPTALALPIALGVTSTRGARLVNAVAAFLEIAVGVWLVITVAGALAGFSVAAAFLVMHPLVMVHLSVLSEPLFLAAMMCVLAATVAFMRAGGERSRTIAAAAGGAAAAVTVLLRYAGVAAVAAIVIWTFIQPGALAVRVRRTLAAALPMVLLVASWIVHESLTRNTGAIRRLGPYGGVAETIHMGAATVVAFLVPLTSDDSLPGRHWFALIVLLAASYLLAQGARRMPSRSVARSTLAATGIFAACYLVVLLGSRVFADPGIPFDERLLVPTFVLLVIAVGVATPEWWRTARLLARVICATLLLAWLGMSFRATQDDVAWAMENGQDFTQTQWTASPLLAWARVNASRRPVFTNWPPAVFFHLHRAAYEAPNEASDTVLKSFADTIRARNGVVLAFDQPNPDFIGPDELKRAAGLREVARFADGIIFVASAATSPGPRHGSTVIPTRIPP